MPDETNASCDDVYTTKTWRNVLYKLVGVTHGEQQHQLQNVMRRTSEAFITLSTGRREP